MQRRENVAANPSSEASSFPLVDFISKWRLRDRRGQTAPAIEAAEAVATSEAAVNNQEPLLSRLAGTGKGYYKHVGFSQTVLDIMTQTHIQNLKCKQLEDECLAGS